MAICPAVLRLFLTMVPNAILCDILFHATLHFTEAYFTTWKWIFINMLPLHTIEKSNWMNVWIYATPCYTTDMIYYTVTMPHYSSPSVIVA